MNKTEIQNLVINATRSALDGAEISRQNAAQLVINSVLAEHSGPKTFENFKAVVAQQIGTIGLPYCCIWSNSVHLGTYRVSDSTMRKVTGMTAFELWRGL